MNKTQLIDEVSGLVDLPKTVTNKVLDTILEKITQALKNNDEVSLVGFGTFLVKKRAARTGRNPKTGEPVQIAASLLPAFKPWKGLKNAINDVADSN